jgi:hypothetical protein
MKNTMRNYAIPFNCANNSAGKMTNVIFFSIKESKMSHISDNLEWRMQERSRFRFLGKLRPVNRAKRLNYVLFFALSSFICNFAT